MKKRNKKAELYSSPKIKEKLGKRDPTETARTRKRMLIAARLEDILLELGWKKKDLAASLGKNPSEVTKWLSGTHNFTTDTLAEIESATGKSLIPVLGQVPPPMGQAREIQGVQEGDIAYQTKPKISKVIKYPLRNIHPDLLKDLQEKYPEAEVWIELGSDREGGEETFPPPS